LRKARNKKFSLLMALVFAFTVIFPAGAAFATDYSTFNSGFKYVTTGKNVPAGTASAVYKDAGDADEFYFEVILPEGVEYTEKPVDDENLDEYVSTGTFVSSDSNRLKVEVGSWASGDKVTFKFNVEDFSALNIPKDFTGNLDVELIAYGVNSSTGNIEWSESDDLTIAKVAGDDITIKAGTVKKVSAGGNKSVAKITVEESKAGSIAATAKVKLIIETDDVEFHSGTSVVGQDGIVVPAGSITQDSDGNDTIYEATVSTPATTFPGTITFTPKLNISPNVDGDIEITVEVDNPAGYDDKDETVTVATVGDVTMEVKDLEDNDNVVYAGQDKELDVTFTLATTDGSSFVEGDMITFQLGSGKFASDPTVDGTGTVKRYDENKAFYYTVGANEGDELDIENIKVSLKNEAEAGDLTLTIGGDYGDLEEIVIATAAKPYTVTADKPAIMSEALGQAAGDITITETDGGAMSTSEFVYVELPSGLELTAKPKIEVTEGNGDAEISSYDDDFFVIKVTKKSSSSKPTTYRVYNLKYDTGKLALAGDVVLEFSGDVAGGKDDTVMTTVANATVVDGNVVTASFKVGDEGVTILNGRTLVQVNMLCDVLGLQKSWDEATKTAYFVKEGKVVAFPMGENAIYINGIKITVDQGGKIVNNYTYATLRGIQMAFGGELTWDDTTKTATFNFSK